MTSTTLPKKVWMAWLQGRAKAPNHVQLIIDLWERFNPDYQVTLLEQKDIDPILKQLGVTQARLAPQVQTDLARTYLLATEGGVWADASLLPSKPLNDWLTQKMGSGFFAFSSTGEPNLVLQNWFLASEKNNALVSAWLDDFTMYFRSERIFPTWKRALLHGKLLDYMRYKLHSKQRDSLYFVDETRGRSCVFYPYAVHNYVLSQLLHDQSALREIWQQTPRSYSALPLLIGRESNDGDTPDEHFLEIALELLPHSPVHKLNARDRRFVRLIETAMERGVLPAR